MTTLTDKQVKEIHKKLKQIDEVAKSLGLTVYRIDIGVDIEGEKCLFQHHALNDMPPKFADAKYKLTDEQKKACKPIDEYLNAENDRLFQTINKKFEKIGLHTSGCGLFHYYSLHEIKEL